MVDAQPYMSNADAESSKLINHGCGIFFMSRNQMMSTVTAMPIPAENIFSSILMTPIRTKN